MLFVTAVWFSDENGLRASFLEYSFGHYDRIKKGWGEVEGEMEWKEE